MSVSNRYFRNLGNVPIGVLFDKNISDNSTITELTISSLDSTGIGFYKLPVGDNTLKVEESARILILIDEKYVDSSDTIVSFPFAKNTSTSYKSSLTPTSKYFTKVSVTLDGDTSNYYIYCRQSGGVYSVYQDSSYYYNTYQIVAPNVGSGTLTITDDLENCTYTTTPTEPKITDEITFNFTANDGYVFNSSVIVWEGTTAHTATKSDDKKTASLTWKATDTSQDITLEVIASAVSEYGTLTISEESVKNCTYTITPASPKITDTVVVNITANDGYNFDNSTPYLKNGLSYTYAEISDDKLSATITWSTTETSSDITLYLRAVAKVITVGNLTIEDYQVTNSKWTTNPDTPTIKDTVIFTFTADEGFYFKSAPQIKENLQYYTATLSEDNKSATYEWTASSTTSDITLQIISMAVSFESVTIIEETVENSSWVSTPSENIKTSDTLVITCTPIENYHFSVVPYVIVHPQGYMNRTVEGIINEDGTATITVTFTENSETTVNLYSYAIPSTGSGSGYLFTLFKINEENMQKIASTRYINLSADTVIDLGDYINTLKKFYCNVPVTENTQSILLGSYKIDTKAPTVTDEIFTLSCGKITVAENNQNASDYESVVSCYLPFVGMVEIDADRIIGRTIELTYTISAINGTCVAQIWSDENVVGAFEGNVAIDLPYILAQTEGRYRGNVNSNNRILYGYTPYIYVFYHANYNENGKVISHDNLYAKLADLSGFNVVEDIDFTGLNIPTEEVDLIEQVFKDGVYL